MDCVFLLSLVATACLIPAGEAGYRDGEADGGRAEASRKGFLRVVGKDALYYNRTGDAVGLWCGEGQVSRLRELGLQESL